MEFGPKEHYPTRLTNAFIESGTGVTNVNFADESISYPNTLYVTTWGGKIYSLDLVAVPEPTSHSLVIGAFFVVTSMWRRRIGYA